MGNAAHYFVDRHLFEGRGEKIAFREASGQKRTLTYSELAKQSSCIADAYEAQGIAREKRAACILLDEIEYPIIFWGSLKCGVLPIALNTLLSTDVYDAILQDSRASILFVSHALLDVVMPALKGNRFIRSIVVVGGKAPAGAIDYETFTNGAKPREPIEASADECAFWLYSSGSTGRPKGVRHVHGALKSTSDTYGAQVLGIRESDTIFSAAKIFFAYGLGNAMTFPMSVGATTVLFAPRPTPDAVLDIITQENVTIFCGVPTLYAALAAYLEAKGLPNHQLRLCISAGEALPADVGNTWQSLVGSEILDGVGSTGMLHIFLSNRPGNVLYGSSGSAVPGYELRCVDENGQKIGKGTGDVGELVVRGASAADGYWNQRDKSRATFEGEWTRTGDKYEIAKDGRYIYCGRTDDMFKVSGIWVSPFEVEQALISHPAILVAAVVAAADDEGLEKPKAYIVMKNAEEIIDVEELKEFVKAKIGKWKYPRWVEVLDDLPKTATGKIQRFKLRVTS